MKNLSKKKMVDLCFDISGILNVHLDFLYMRLTNHDYKQVRKYIRKYLKDDEKDCTCDEENK